MYNGNPNILESDTVSQLLRKLIQTNLNKSAKNKETVRDL